jgi:aryl-alcohol dehydrogenase-like predicted oxidoreductase
MKFKELGRTGLKVSQLCLGTMTWGQQNTQDDAFAQLSMAEEAGITFIDTAEMYAIPTRPQTAGLTETYIGNWFSQTGRRDRFVVATKVAGGRSQPWIRDGRRPGAADLVAAVDGSLRRLQTDHIDLYQIHWPWRGSYHFENGWTYVPSAQRDMDDFAESLTTLDGLVRAGKLRHVGVSNETAWGIMQYLRLSELHGLPRLVSVQNEYSLLRRLFDHDLAEIAYREDVGLIAYSSLAAGAISGKYLDGAVPPGSRGDIGRMWRHHRHTEPAIRAYIALAREHGLEVTQMALAFCLSRPFMTAVILGATSLAQLQSNIAAAEITLSPELLAAIDAIHRRFPNPV